MTLEELSKLCVSDWHDASDVDGLAKEDIAFCDAAMTFMPLLIDVARAAAILKEEAWVCDEHDELKVWRAHMDDLDGALAKLSEAE